MQKAMERRLNYFFREKRQRREEIQGVVVKLQEFGPVVVIGGMIRDLALAGTREFGSDVDFVVKPTEINEFQAFMAEQLAERNRFGGYKLHGGHWRIDVWPLQKTWAYEAGHVEINEFSDLLNSTFFDFDAIIYDLQLKKLNSKPDYFDRLTRRELEINLLANPNPVGNAVRALRYAATKRFGWGPKLCRFMAEQIEETGWKDLEEREIKSFRTWCIENMDQNKFREELFKHLCRSPEKTFRSQVWCRTTQPEFRFHRSTEKSCGG